MRHDVKFDTEVTFRDPDGAIVIYNARTAEKTIIVNNITLAVTKRVFQSIDCGTSCVTCCAVLLEPQLLDIMIVQFKNEKVSNHGSIPITIDCTVVAFIVFEEGFHQPIKRTKQSVFLDVTVFRHTLVD
ncbi:hypothetical protein TNCV_419791 [Trichonephila clavipes]|uniref:Uncharacterized protein n=1 Tax=Trichonephila clavipes TaxID=2585209 RepID=A0A8X6S0R8_TRICX|nr:hypothetical protein TNCV_419791 [Trichonephila clavipes]